ncbi:MAG: GNAT family N-acetyltransferase [Dehalococcoidia bacterium]|jgi:ribosomal protein S18 acetylase RimI-like enzyme
MMMSEITIRPCRREECPAILKLWELAETIPSTTDTLKVLELMLRRDGDLLLVAERDGQIIGTVMGGWDGWRGNIYRLAVLPEYRRRGIGSALVSEVEDRLKSRGVKKISIMVERTDESANDFWNALKKSEYRYDPRIIRYTKTL